MSDIRSSASGWGIQRGHPKVLSGVFCHLPQCQVCLSTHTPISPAQQPSSPSSQWALPGSEPSPRVSIKCQKSSCSLIPGGQSSHLASRAQQSCGKGCSNRGAESVSFLIQQLFCLHSPFWVPSLSASASAHAGCAPSPAQPRVSAGSTRSHNIRHDP